MTASPSRPIAVIGGGYWGKNLIRNFYNLEALGWVCDTREDVLESYRQQYPGIQTTSRLDELWANSDVEGVVIATPSLTHFDLGDQALKAGKHVYGKASGKLV